MLLCTLDKRMEKAYLDAFKKACPNLYNGLVYLHNQGETKEKVTAFVRQCTFESGPIRAGCNYAIDEIWKGGGQDDQASF